MKMKKVIIAMLTVTVMILSALAPAFTSTVTFAPNITSATVPGNLGSDTYTDYPFTSTSLTMGLSQYGEMIDPATMTGLNYGGAVDPFAPSMNLYNGNPSPPQYEWIEGWILNCTYVIGGSYANIWALATYSDYAPGTGGIGGNWNQMVTVGSTDLSVRGGRKTSGAAVTTPITVLYNGPREYVATTTTTLYVDTSYTTPLLNVTFTFVFDKAGKDVEVLKDVKRITTSKSIGYMTIQFGDRGEWDLGVGTPPISYAHIFENQPTVYDGSWQPWYANAPGPYDGTYDVAQIVSASTNYTGFEAFWPKPITSWVGATQQEATRNTILTSLGTETEDQNFTGLLKDTDNGLYYVTPTLTPIVYPQNTTTGNIVWQNDPMVFVGGINKIVTHSATFSDPADQVYWDGTHVYFPTGYTPSVGTDIKLVYETQASKDDMAVEPGSPFVIGEWAFMMNDGSANAFQGVTEYGITDTHNGAYPGPLDREVTYLLDQTFNPTDLYSAVEQSTSRWVEYQATPTDTDYTDFQPTNTPAVYVNDQQWDQYNVNSERVEDLNTSTLLHRVANDPMMGDPQEYGVDYGSTFGQNYLTDIYLPDTGDTYKITYSTFNSFYVPQLSPYLDFTGFNVTQVNTVLNGFYGGYLLNDYTDILGATHTITYNLGIVASNSSNLSTNTTVTLNGNLYDSGSDVTVFKEDTLQQSISESPINQTATSNGLSLTFNGINMDWSVKAPTLTDLHIDWFNFNCAYTITLGFYINSTGQYYNMTSNFLFGTEDGILQEQIPGSYQWGIVGTNAATVDSAGLSMISAAFKDKEVEYGLGGSDIFAGTNNTGSQMPFVMAELGTSHTDPSWNNYYYNNFGGTYTTNNDQRVALTDAWDPYAYIGTVQGGIIGTTVNVPVTTSNMIGVGGPLANMLSYYGNDFMDALYAEPWFAAGSPWSGNIAALTCWNRNSYSDTATTGYATISTAQDINGTTMLLLWGLTGKDTYYASQWFQQEGIYELQQAPLGLTSIILKITYESTSAGYKPTGFKVVECLGRVSEDR